MIIDELDAMKLLDDVTIWQEAYRKKYIKKHSFINSHYGRRMKLAKAQHFRHRAWRLIEEALLKRGSVK